MSENPTTQILVADDDEGIRFVLQELLGDLGYAVTAAADGQEALDRIRDQRFDLMLLDVNLPRVDGLEVLRRTRQSHPELIILVITGNGTPDCALEAIKEGAYDYFTKPFEIQELRITIQRALEKKLLLEQIRLLESRISSQNPFHEIIGSSDAMQRVFALMRRVVDNDVPVLITGESGTGKEMVAEAIHRQGPRRNAPIVKINCAAIPESLLESELFGHEKGSFTGAIHTHPGKFEQAQNGTLFLDEIGDMPPALQAKILRAVQEREVQRVGGKAPLKVNVRLVTATNKNLAAEVAEKRFREDLYFRINVIPIELPPLRERLTDIPLLAKYFIQEYKDRLGKAVEGVSPEVMDLFLQYPGPGNERELENVIQRTLIMAGGPCIQVEDLPPAIAPFEIRSRSAAPPPDKTDLRIPMAREVERAVAETERRYIQEALKVARSREEAAHLLGISRKSLYSKIQRHALGG